MWLRWLTSNRKSIATDVDLHSDKKKSQVQRFLDTYPWAVVLLFRSQVQRFLDTYPWAVVLLFRLLLLSPIIVVLFV
jgi:hypothetical protein